jgi:hypothetical protein
MSKSFTQGAFRVTTVLLLAVFLSFLLLGEWRETLVLADSETLALPQNLESAPRDPAMGTAESNPALVLQQLWDEAV